MLILEAPDRARDFRVALLLALLALAVRVSVFFGVPTLVTADSLSYLKIAHDLATRAPTPDFRLGALRLPGYPRFLSLLFRFPTSSETTLALGQSGLGVLSVLALYLLARALRATPTQAAFPALFLSLSPPLLAFERAVMSETLALVLLVLFATACTFWMQRPESHALAALSGLLAGLLLLTRLNAIAFLSLLAAPPLVPLLRLSQHSTPARRRILPAIVAGTVFLSTLLPWLHFNYRHFGRWTLFPSSQKVRLVYAVQHGLLDASAILRTIEQAGVPLRNASPVMQMFWGLHELPGGGEDRAKELLDSVRSKRPQELSAARFQTMKFFLGLLSRVSEPAPWLLFEQPVISRAREGSLLYLSPTEILQGERFAPQLRNWVTAYARSRIFLLPLLISSLIFLVPAFPAQPLQVFLPVALLLASYLATALLHAWTLADYDRFFILFDWVPVLGAATLLRPHRNLLPPE